MERYIINVMISERADAYMLEDVGAMRKIEGLTEMLNVIMRRLLEMT